MTIDLEAACERLLQSAGVVFLLGGIDSGKTTFARTLAARAVSAGIATAIVDADIEQSTVGPPTTVGLKLCAGAEQFDRAALRAADALAFVGSLNPARHLLPLVTGTAKMVRKAREAGCRLIIVDTSSLVHGIDGQTLKFFKMDLVEPDFVVSFQRGGELEPVVGIAQRFTPAEIIQLPAAPETAARSVEDRIAFKEEQFAAYFAGRSSRWRVKPTVFMPRLPPDFEFALLQGLVVGMEDGKGSCAGIGVLGHDADDGILRMTSPVTEGVRGLRLGSVRIDTSGRTTGTVDLRELFGSR